MGGLILIKQPSTTVNNSQPSSTVYAPLYDGNGNITELCTLSTSTVSARYEYSAFGETITTDGSAIADSNPFRFSTKYEDRETGLYYYGYRYYAPETGRWVSRDPIKEKGGINLYGMVGNDGVNKWDRLGHIAGPFGDCCEPGTKRKAKFKKHYLSSDGIDPTDADPFKDKANNMLTPDPWDYLDPYETGAYEAARAASNGYFDQLKDTAQKLQEMKNSVGGYLWVMVDYEKCEREKLFWTKWNPSKAPYKHKCSSKRYRAGEVDWWLDLLPCISEAEEAAKK